MGGSKSGGGGGGGGGHDHDALSDTMSHHSVHGVWPCRQPSGSASLRYASFFKFQVCVIYRQSPIFSLVTKNTF